MSDEMNLQNQKIMVDKKNGFYEQLRRLKDHYDKLENEQGSYFNIFKLLNLSTKEAVLHTPLIADLLNPRGSHRQGCVFLQKFIEIINAELKKNDIEIDYQNVCVYSEKYIGKISEDKERGGVIDILITDGINAIALENKIYAPDQEKQLVRYHNYLKANQTLLYLNLYGTSASEISTGKKLKDGRDYHIISYKKHILCWLGECKKHVSELPIIIESLNQYTSVIKRLCGISINSKFETGMKELIKENIDLSYEVYAHFNDVKFELIEHFREELKKYLESKLIEFESYSVENFSSVDYKHSSLFIRESKASPVFFAIGKFSGIRNLLCGVMANFDIITKSQIKALKDENSMYEWYLTKIDLGENMNSPETLKKLADRESCDLLVQFLGDRIINFVQENETLVEEAKRKITHTSSKD